MIKFIKILFTNMCFYIRKFLVLSLIFFLIINIRVLSQPFPILEVDNDTIDIEFLDCASIKQLDFHASIAWVWLGDKKYTWTLYKDNISIETKTGFSPCSTSCFPACPYVTVDFFNISPLSGEYKVRLEVESATFIHVFCLGFWASTGNVIFDEYTNIINVTKFDDGLECTCNMPYNINVSCGFMNYVHSFGQPYTARARNILEANCTIPSGKTTTFIAEEGIILKPYFHAVAGSYFHAYIDDCPGIERFSNYGSNENYEWDIDSTDIISPMDYAENNDDSKNNSINEINQIDIYPNPTKGIFNLIVDFYTEQRVKIAISDILGNEIYVVSEATILQKNYQINLGSHPNGIYIVRLITNDEVINKKIILSK